MQFRDLKKQYAVLKDEIDAAVAEVMTECNFINGRQVGEIEEELAQYAGTVHCISCANGTDALHLAMRAWGIGEGDAVFVPDFTFFSSGEIVMLLGAVPIFVDVDEDTFNISIESLKNQIKKVEEAGELTPKAIVAVDLFGLPADFTALRKIADEHGMYIMEDAAQAFGAEINGKKACSFGDMAITSFFPAKPLGGYGDGGAIFTDNDEWTHLIESYKAHGKGENKYDNIRIGINSRLDTIQAAILKVKLKAFKTYELDDVNKAAKKYSAALSEIAGIKLPLVPDKYVSSWAQYSIRLADRKTRDGLREYLKQHDIPSMVYYQKPMHLQGAFNDCAPLYNTIDYVTTNKLCDTILSLPMHPYISDGDIDKVANRIKEFLG